MSDRLPRVGGLPEPDKYERLVQAAPDIWWSGAGPFAGLHELNVVRVEYFSRVFGGFGGKRALDIGCGGGILAEALASGTYETGTAPAATIASTQPRAIASGSAAPSRGRSPSSRR